MASTTTVISDAVARFYLEHFGKGPLQASTHMHGDTAVTVLRDILTPPRR